MKKIQITGMCPGGFRSYDHVIYELNFEPKIEPWLGFVVGPGILMDMLKRISDYNPENEALEVEFKGYISPAKRLDIVETIQSYADPQNIQVNYNLEGLVKRE